MATLQKPKTKKLSPDDPLARHPPHYLHELPLEYEERLEKLFVTLDKDGDGKIDVRDLSAALKECGVHYHYAEVGSNSPIGNLFRLCV